MEVRAARLAVVGVVVGREVGRIGRLGDDARVGAVPVGAAVAHVDRVGLVAGADDARVGGVADADVPRLRGAQRGPGQQRRSRRGADRRQDHNAQAPRSSHAAEGTRGRRLARRLTRIAPVISVRSAGDNVVKTHHERRGAPRGREPQDRLAGDQRGARRDPGHRREGHRRDRPARVRAQRPRALAAPRPLLRDARARDRGRRQPVLFSGRPGRRGRRARPRVPAHHGLRARGRRARARADRRAPEAPRRRAADRARRPRPSLYLGHRPHRLPRPPAAGDRGRHGAARQPRRRPPRGRAPGRPRPHPDRLRRGLGRALHDAGAPGRLPRGARRRRHRGGPLARP